MINTIYISPTHLKCVVGSGDKKSITVNSYAQLPLPEGVMLGGVITDEDTLAYFIGEFITKLKLTKNPTYLIIENPSIVVRPMEIPPVAAKTAFGLIEKEFDQYLSEDADMVYDFTVIEQKTKAGGVKILAVAAPVDVLSIYKRVAIRAGLKIKSMDIGANVLIRVATIMPQFKAGTKMLVSLDGKALSLMVIENGKFFISNRYRLVHPQGTPDWATEIVGYISSTLQFKKSQRDENHVEACYLAGFTDTEITSISTNGVYLDAVIEALDTSGAIRLVKQVAGTEDWDPNNYILNLGAMVGRKK
ncbi:MAG: pilus assembly protein PilM [Clostridiales Family XIII bacterium]|jgi:Tfp pilus assembly PilM family ATPase|nr:pilus assembly protein PilM [Clostridiales Family XIII bacterium]